jgi:diguanylate cyclase (GGDEF)-like protein
VVTPGKRLPSPDVGIALLVATMLAVTVGLFVALGDQQTASVAEPGIPWWLLLPLFALAEVAVLHVPTSRGGAHTHSLRELPNVLGLAFLAPTAYLLAHLAGTGAALLLHRRQRGTKLAFNLALFSLEVVVGITAYRLVLGDASPVDPRGWLAALTATLLTDVLSALLIAGVIALHERELDRSVLAQTLTRGSLAVVANTALACLVVVLLVLESSALPLLVVVLLVMFVTYRAYLVLWVGHARVHQLYRFVQETADLTGAEELVTVVLREARDVMHASAAEVVLLDGRGQIRRRALSEEAPDVVETAEPVPEETWWHCALDGEAVRADVTECDLHGADCRGGVAAPLRLAEAGVTGVLLVHDRTVDVDPFTPEDAQLFATLTAHASAALDNAFMLDKLRRVAAEREHQAMHDTLTGLPNRAGLSQRLEAALDGGTLALLLLGTDDIARVDDVLGHSSGMALLRLLAQRLGEASPEPVYRLEGDQFAVVLAGRAAGDALDLAGRLVAALRQPLLLGAVPLHVTARVGIACAPLDGADAEDLIRLAVLSMHTGAPGEITTAHGKALGVQDGQRRLVLAADLSTALDEGGLEVWYQPQVVLRDGTLHGAEALLRWQHPTYSWVNPSEIVNVAERTGQLLRLTEMVLATALEQRARWQRDGLSVSVSVNLAAQTIQEDLAERVARHLWATRTPARLLVLEVTESGVMRDSERGLAVLRSLSQLGVELSIDDFGTGHSSLAYLDRLPVQEVKIDRAFVQALEGREHDSAVLRSTIGLAHEMGLRVVVEGVEGTEALRKVEDLGSDLGQGYVIARPMPGGDLFAWWTVRRHPLVCTGPDDAASRSVRSVDDSRQL